MTFNTDPMPSHIPAPQATLIVKHGPQIGIQFPLAGDSFVLGREETCDIVIQDAEVSRRHTQLAWEGNTFIVRDLGSTNGTFVNGSQITGTTAIRPGDTVGLGQTSLILEVRATDRPSSTSYPMPQGYMSPPMPQSRLKAIWGNWWAGGCGCLILVGICVIAFALILQFAGLDLASIREMLGI